MASIPDDVITDEEYATLGILEIADLLIERGSAHRDQDKRKLGDDIMVNDDVIEGDDDPDDNFDREAFARAEHAWEQGWLDRQC